MDLLYIEEIQYDFYLSKYELIFKKIQQYQEHLNRYWLALFINLYFIVGVIYRNIFKNVIKYLQKSIFHKYNLLIDISVVDFPGKQLRFQVNYFLLSCFYNNRIQLQIYTKEILSLNSISLLYPGATWLEREVYDLYGIIFSFQKDLRRILTDYAFKGFPLRKDFPLTGFYEIYYNESKKNIYYTHITLAQEYRIFYFQNTWIAS